MGFQTRQVERNHHPYYCAHKSGGNNKQGGRMTSWLKLTRMHVYEIRPRKDKRGFDLISDALPFGRWWYGEPDAIANAIGYAKFARRL